MEMARDIYEVFVENVTNRMGELAMSRADLAIEMGVTKSAVTQLLNGYRKPGIDVIAKCAKALRCSPDLLIREFEKI